MRNDDADAFLISLQPVRSSIAHSGGKRCKAASPSSDEGEALDLDAKVLADSELVIADVLQEPSRPSLTPRKTKAPYELIAQ